MRRSKADKDATHAKIVSVAAKRFRERGLTGIGIDEVMCEVGATVGGFYRHFASRDDLVVEALRDAFKTLDKMEEDAADLPALLERYVSDRHRVNPGDGCALTALAGDVRHASEEVRAVFTERIEHTLQYYAERVKGGDAMERRSKAILLFSAALGGLTIARAVNDKALAREIVAALQRQLVALSQQPGKRKSPLVKTEA